VQILFTLVLAFYPFPVTTWFNFQAFWYFFAVMVVNCQLIAGLIV